MTPAAHAPIVLHVDRSVRRATHHNYEAACTCGWRASVPTSSQFFAMNEAKVHVAMHAAVAKLPTAVIR